MNIVKKILLSILFVSLPVHLEATNIFFLLLSGLGFSYELFQSKTAAPVKKEVSSWLEQHDILKKNDTAKKENSKKEKAPSIKEKIKEKRAKKARRAKVRALRMGASTLFLLLGLFSDPFSFLNTDLINDDTLSIDPAKHPKTKPIQFRDRLDEDQAPFLDISDRIFPLFAIFASFVPDWQGSNPSLETEAYFLAQRNAQAKQYETLSLEEKQELFTWVYRQYWNCSKEEISAFFETELKKDIMKKEYPALCQILTDFLRFLEHDLNLAAEPVTEKSFCNCADQGETADCGPYSLYTAILLSQNQEERLLDKAAYKKFTSDLREKVVKKAPINTTKIELERKRSGNLDEGELRHFVPVELKNIFFVDAEQLEFLYHPDPTIETHNPFDEMIATFKATGKVFILCNTKAHWLTLECTKTADDKIKVRAFDPGSAREKNGRLKLSATGATNIATTMLYAFIQELNKSA